MCIGLGCSPSDFWQMTPSEVYVYLDAHKQKVKYGSLTHDDVNELASMKNEPAPIVNGVQTQWL